MIKIFDTKEEYDVFSNYNTEIDSGDLYYIRSNGDIHFYTNNIDGQAKIYDSSVGWQPSGTIYIDSNSESIDVSQYANAVVDVPVPPEYVIPQGQLTITANSNYIDVADFASVYVDVPVPPEYIIPEGNIELTENATNVDVSQYATATINVEGGQGGFQPSGNINITENGDNIDVYDYATATVNVPIPEEYIKPQGVLMVNSNTSQNIDIKQFAYLSVDVPQDDSVLRSLISRTCSEIYIPDTITEIGDYAFAYCKQLSYVYIPDSVTYIGAYAFYGCESLDNVHIPDSVEEIGSYAFYGSGIGTVFVDPETPPTIGDDIFDDNTIDEIVVPNEAKQDYIDDPDWGRWFSNIIDEDEYEEEHPAPRGDVWVKAVVQAPDMQYNTDRSKYAYIMNWDTSRSDGNTYWTYMKADEGAPISTSWLTDNEHRNMKYVLPYKQSLSYTDSTKWYPNSYHSVEYKSAYWSDARDGEIIVSIPSNLGGLDDSHICYFTEIPSYFDSIRLKGCTALTRADEFSHMKHIHLVGCISLRGNITSPYNNDNYYSFPNVETFSFESSGSNSTIILGENLQSIDARGLNHITIHTVYCYALVPPVAGTNLLWYDNTQSRYTTRIYVPAQSLNDYQTSPYWSTYSANIFAMD